jgi:FkbM family methyltransferase
METAVHNANTHIKITMSNKKFSTSFLFKYINRIERKSAYAQGKGYGTATIRHEVKLVLRLLKETPLLAIDIGGNIGEYTAELRRTNPNLEIHIFEPSATNIDKLKRRFESDKNIKLVPLAVSDISGSTSLFSNEPGSGLASLTKRKLDHLNIAFDFKESIHTVRFEDYWIYELNRKHMDIVKLDIEGHELSALNGFGEAIKEMSVVQFEFGGCNIDTRTYFQDFWYYFKDKNFEIFRITPLGLEKIERYRESDEFFSTTNYIAVNRGY